MSPSAPHTGSWRISPRPATWSRNGTGAATGTTSRTTFHCGTRSAGNEPLVRCWTFSWTPSRAEGVERAVDETSTLAAHVLQHREPARRFEGSAAVTAPMKAAGPLRSGPADPRFDYRLEEHIALSGPTPRRHMER